MLTYYGIRVVGNRHKTDNEIILKLLQFGGIVIETILLVGIDGALICNA